MKENQLDTALAGKERTTKLDYRIDLLGKLDLIQSRMMKCYHCVEKENDKKVLEELATDIFLLMSEVCGANTNDVMNSMFEAKLEKICNLIKEEPIKFSSFVLPGLHSETQAELDILRCEIRQTELLYCKFYDEYKTSQYVLEWLNKLSLYIYYLARRY